MNVIAEKPRSHNAIAQYSNSWSFGTPRFDSWSGRIGNVYISEFVFGFMRRWLVILLAVLLVVVLVVAGAVFYFYNKYSEEVGVFLDLKDEADELFDQGVVGPDDCSSALGCGRYCVSNKELCVGFCEDNPGNELCSLVVGSVESGELSLEELEDLADES